MRTALVSSVAALLASVVTASAFDLASITIKVGYGAGGTYDLSSRLVAKHLGRFLPGNPQFVVQNVPGGGSMLLTTLMLGSEPRDGSVIASISSAIPFAPTLDPDNASFDPEDIIWLGSLADEPAVCITTKASGIETMEAFLSEDFLIGASGRASATYQQAAIVKNGLNAAFNIVTGFDGVTEIELAMERGEIAGHCTASLSDLGRKGMLDRVNIIGKFGTAPTAGLEDVPRFSELIEDADLRTGAELIEAVRDISYPMMVVRGTPDETVAVLREAYAAVASDPDFVAEAEALGEFVLSPKTGAEMQAIVEGHLRTPAALEAARALLE